MRLPVVARWVIGIVGGLLALTLIAANAVQMAVWPTRSFDRAVAVAITRKASVHVPVARGPTVAEAESRLAIPFPLALLVLNGLPGTGDNDVDGPRSSAFYSVHGWLAVAAVRTPAHWAWKTGIVGPPATALARAHHDVVIVAAALKFWGEGNSMPSTMYSVATEGALEGAAAIAVTTVPFTHVALNVLNDAMGPAPVLSVCHGLSAATGKTACNSLTVLWVRPRPGVSIRAY